jgi:4-aminobutyrate aminotransferase-like enzyme
VVTEIRGRGLFWGVQLRDAGAAAAVVRGSLARGVIVLQSGVEGDVVTIAPPLVIDESQLARAIDSLEVAIQRTA